MSVSLCDAASVFLIWVVCSRRHAVERAPSARGGCRLSGWHCTPGWVLMIGSQPYRVALLWRFHCCGVLTGRLACLAEATLQLCQALLARLMEH